MARSPTVSGRSIKRSLSEPTQLTWRFRHTEEGNDYILQSPQLLLDMPIISCSSLLNFCCCFSSSGILPEYTGWEVCATLGLRLDPEVYQVAQVILKIELRVILFLIFSEQ